MTAIARPYVAAAFEYANANHEIPAWENMLVAAATIAKNPAVSELLMSPQITSEQMVEFFSSILVNELNTARKNFICLLAENHRLNVLPDIAELFKEYRAVQEKSITVQVVSAIELPNAYKQKLSQSLAKRLQRQIELQCDIDPSLIGGAIIRAGDTVIDGSIRGKLARLEDFI
jgi:F-type H+-transporting ATPase subunit delta